MKIMAVAALGAVVVAVACFASAAEPGSASTKQPPTKQPPTKQECVGANEKAQDLRGSGKLHEARASLATCLSTSCPRPLREDCAARLADIEAAMPTVVFVAKDTSSNDLGDVRVTMDDRPLAEKLDGNAIAIDPGEHRFGFEAAGFRPIETAVVLREGDKKRRVMVFLDTVAAARPPLAVMTPGQRPAKESAAGAGKTQRTVALVLGGAGVAWLAVGGVFGVITKLSYDQAASECPSNLCSPKGHQDQQTAFGQATVADIAFAAGGGLVVAGAVLFFTAPSKAGGVAIGPTMVNRGAGIGVEGAF